MLVNILTYGAIAVALAAAIGALTTKTFHVETTINAPAEKIWEVLTDTAAYPEWNPTFVEVDGTYSQGGKVLNKVQDPSGAVLEMTATVAMLNPARELRQKGGVPLVITFDHRWILEPVEGGTKVTQHEVDRGLYLWFWNSDWIEPAYAKTSAALKARVEEQ
ncbi:SRPBCC family protein [Cognatishimia sp.]|uniref:SRPBCC family protein n=1 Tax=Cognatishimia sp. TaxID=2211648 RepID=UPI0035127564|nr:SRPBCC domain-containing protein [Cognatishimia sp.]